MNLLDILSPKAIKAPLDSTEKHSAIDELVDVLDQAGLISDPDSLKQVVWERECQRSTGIGEGLAIPHGKSRCSDEIVMAVGLTSEPIDYDAVDGEPVRMLILLASPPEKTSDHIQALGRISRLMSDAQFREQMFQADSPRRVYELFEQAESEQSVTG